MTSNGPPEAAGGSDLTLRDELALDRTHLANERTLLAYIRTALTLVIAGLTILHFVEGGFLLVAGVVFIPTGVLMGFLGAARFVRFRRAVESARRK